MLRPPTAGPRDDIRAICAMGLEMVSGVSFTDHLHRVMLPLRKNQAAAAECERQIRAHLDPVLSEPWEDEEMQAIYDLAAAEDLGLTDAMQIQVSSSFKLCSER